jgi:NAD(P)-dependent dehydrogenase (short-subunit alcohol dehydrogenase family)
MGVVLVTGCRSGFGQKTAIEAARRGHTVYAGLRDLATAGPLMAETEGLPVHPLQLDVTVPEQRVDAVRRILHEQGRIDGLVNNAGKTLGGFLEQLGEDELRDLFEVNVLAVWAMTREVLPAMRAQRSGTIVMLSSVSGRFALPGLGAYATTKFALEGMSEAWRHELAPFGVRVVVVEPGPYATDIWDRNRNVSRSAADAGSPYAAMVARLDQVARENAVTNAGDPLEVAVRIADLLEQSHPRLRHPMGPSAVARTVAARVLPFFVLEWLIERVLRLRPLAG